MYNVTLINLAPDAGSVAALAHVELRDLRQDGLRERLQNFCAIDPIENANAETEIRVQVRRESFLIRTEQKKLILYDMNRRELPAQLLTVAEAMHELDGTANAARNEAVMLARATAAPWATEPVLPVVAPVAAPNKLRMIAMAVTAILLLGVIVYLTMSFADEGAPVGFVPVEPAERDTLNVALTGVYLTGSEPGQHGIVVAGPGELKLFELAAVEAPRVVYATYSPGRVGQKVFLSTDQPGGLIEVPGDGTLVYGGEIYRRLP